MQDRRSIIAAVPSARGFTLVELVMVIVLVSILVVFGGGFIVQSAKSYFQSVGRSQLIQQGRQAIERATRELRNAVPNSVRVSSNNLCIEWLPIVSGANYLGELPDQANGAAATGSINTAPADLGPGNIRYVTVGALAATELYGAAPPAAALFGSLDDSTIPNVITLAAAKRFLRNSVNHRLFLAGAPRQLCVSGGRLTLHENYTTAGAYPDGASLSGAPPNAGTLLSLGVSPLSEMPFALSGGTESRNTLVSLELPFEKNGDRLVLRHEIMVRNVP